MSTGAINLFQNTTRFSFNSGTLGLAKHLLEPCLQQESRGDRRKSQELQGFSPPVPFAAQKKPVESPAAINQTIKAWGCLPLRRVATETV